MPKKRGAKLTRRRPTAIPVRPRRPSGRFAFLTLFAASITAAASGLLGSPGLITSSGDHLLVRAWPRLALDPDEGFSPASGDAGIEWSGSLSILRAGEYRFFPSGAVLSIDGEMAGRGPMTLEPGPVQIELRVARQPGSARVAVEWEGPGFLREPIPPARLAHESQNPDGPDGRTVFEDLGCPNCHQSDSPSIQGRVGPLLTGIGSRVKPAWIRSWLDSPSEFRSWSTMPVMLSETERADVAAFLVTQRGEPVDEPSVRRSNEERGRTTFQSIGCGACHSTDLPLAGLGSKMTIGHLQRYLLDPIRFSPGALMPSFHLSASEALDLAAYLGASRNEAFERLPPYGDATRGATTVESSGCLACHELAGFASASQAPRLEELDPELGCLADAVPVGVPRYRLSDAERIALRQFVARYQSVPDSVEAPTFDLPRRLAQLRCHACHEIDSRSPSGPLAEYAPSLTGVGEKLQTEWIERVLSSPTQTLDWQELRMPSYGASRAAWLADALAKASGVHPRADMAPESDGSAQAGRGRLGMDGSGGGLGCVGCHGWGEFPSLGENGPNLLRAGERLRRPWFERWMRDPARILPGTSMPNYFGGIESPRFVSVVSDIWATFRAAPDLLPPFGFETVDALPGDEAMPVPTDRAVVVRWDMPEATPAAIAVGLPGGVSYCFDAGESRLRYAWRGGFADISQTLFNKKNRETNLTETARIVGEIFFREGTFPIRSTDRGRIPQRRFRGYRLVDSIPEFHYELDGVEVRERIVAIEGGLKRHFRLDGVERPMWFVPAEAEGVEVHSTLDGFVIPAGETVAFEVTVVAKE